MHKCLELLEEGNLFSALDANNGSWKVKIANGDRRETALNARHAWFEFICTLFWLKNAPGRFQRVVHVTLSIGLWLLALLYLKDVVIFSKSPEAQIKPMNQVLAQIRDARVPFILTECIRFFIPFNSWVMSFTADNWPYQIAWSSQFSLWSPLQTFKSTFASGFVQRPPALVRLLLKMLLRWPESCGITNPFKFETHRECESWPANKTTKADHPAVFFPSTVRRHQHTGDRRLWSPSACKGFQNI